MPDRPENRLLKLALVRVREATGNPDNWRLAQELSSRLSDVPSSNRVGDDFRVWGSDRLMGHYCDCEALVRTNPQPQHADGTPWGSLGVEPAVPNGEAF